MFVRAACIKQNTYTRNYLIIFSKIYIFSKIRNASAKILDDTADMC